MLEVSNADVTWDGDFDGFTPRVSPRAAAAFHADEETIAALIRLLSDPDRFVVAHVGLTKIAGLQYPTAPTWNGLTIELGPDGRATIDPEQRHALARRWQAWRVASPRPRVLP